MDNFHTEKKRHELLIDDDVRLNDNEMRHELYEKPPVK